MYWTVGFQSCLMSEALALPRPTTVARRSIVPHMTKQEFITRQQAMTRATNKRLGFWMVFFFAALCGCIPLSSYIERHEQDYRWIGTAFGIGLLTFLCTNLGLMAWYGLRQQRRYGHRCPHCNKSLVGFGAQIAIATGNCGQCGERVFSDQAA